MKKSKSLLLLLTLVLAVGTLLSACGSNESKNGASNGGNNAANNAANEGDVKLAADQTLRINLSAEPPTFDPAQAQDSQANTVLKMMYEGLVRLDADGKEVPGAAESWDVDGTKYTFHLRKDAKWSNGDPVTAKDFVFAWERVLSPDTQPAAPYAYQLYYIKNAEEFNNGTIKDFNEVGLKATDDYTLEVELVNPTPYFLGLTSFYTLYPVHQSVKDDAKWATDPSKMIVNGPFTLTNWTTGQSLEVTKNDQYWDKDNIKLNKISMSLVESGATELESYRNGELDRAGAPNGEIPSDQIPIVQKELPDEYKVKGIAGTYYYQFNSKAEPFQNAKIRKAFSMAIDRQAIVDKITMGGQIPAYGVVPEGILGAEGEFRTEHSDKEYFQENVDEAKKLLEEGMKEEGYTKLPDITLIHNNGEGHKKIATAAADMWKKNLGVDVKIQNQEWGVFLKNRQNLDYQIARSGWSADFNDPMTFMDLWMTGAGNNDLGYSNPEYDKLLKDARSEADLKKRDENFAKAEEIFIKDDMAYMPIYYYTNVALEKKNLKGVVVDYSGTIDYTRAYLTEE
ncbi:peptide ABC transporter substrate-binding protein [Paenibacillus motobuensis]|uniref:peptide ABC transporter substrate-binding protein n=1 Tax=Paenibacillus TaxID=44249 RepID=UPI00203BF715|nr:MULTISPECIES: peptide ABC transporter substrate-binding protein [Paenibacillus]MCM3040479.1 peptide ABC transporter substrate-binding protein [Paenibacillus lutimineralis]MCM3647583.1 peptide ABC transporter substrate-binding protein [Paenibacillus motobuensis]